MRREEFATWRFYFIFKYSWVLGLGDRVCSVYRYRYKVFVPGPLKILRAKKSSCLARFHYAKHCLREFTLSEKKQKNNKSTLLELLLKCGSSPEDYGSDFNWFLPLKKRKLLECRWKKLFFLFLFLPPLPVVPPLNQNRVLRSSFLQHHSVFTIIASRAAFASFPCTVYLCFMPHMSHILLTTSFQYKLNTNPFLLAGLKKK